MIFSYMSVKRIDNSALTSKVGPREKILTVVQKNCLTTNIQGFLSALFSHYQILRCLSQLLSQICQDIIDTYLIY